MTPQHISTHIANGPLFAPPILEQKKIRLLVNECYDTTTTRPLHFFFGSWVGIPPQALMSDCYIDNGYQICSRAMYSDEFKAADAVYINALHDKMPECDRVEGVVALEKLTHADECHVYCAQRSCDAAQKFIATHADELEHKCGVVKYLHNGALAMPKSKLVDGAACHAKIVDFNKADERACLTCKSTAQPIDAKLNGKPIEARYAVTDTNIPEWYLRTGNHAPLPNHFSTDPRHFNWPVLYSPPDATARLDIDISRTGLPADAVLGYWASRPSEETLEAGAAYDDFRNRGIAQCEAHKCVLRLDMPGAYTAEGRVFKPHVHFAEWAGEHWALDAKTVEFV